jgi:hypothetical protein
MMPQELDRFPQSRFPKFGHRLCMFLHRHMQGITADQNLPRRYKAFEFRRSHRFDRLRVIRQPAEDLLRYPLRLCLIGKVFLDSSSRLIKGELVHFLTAINRPIEFDCLLPIREFCRHILLWRMSTKRICYAQSRCSRKQL